MRIADLFMILPMKTMDDKINMVIENVSTPLQITWREALAMELKYEVIFYIPEAELILVRRILKNV